MSGSCIDRAREPSPLSVRKPFLVCLRNFLCLFTPHLPLYRPNRPGFDITPVTLRFKLESRRILIRPFKSVDPRVILFHYFPQLFDRFAELLIFIRLSLL